MPGHRPRSKAQHAPSSSSNIKSLFTITLALKHSLTIAVAIEWHIVSLMMTIYLKFKCDFIALDIQKISNTVGASSSSRRVV
jgi:hypothetical protein